MANPNNQARFFAVVGPTVDALHIFNPKGQIVAWIDGTGTGQGNLANSGAGINFSDAEVPGGSVNGSNVTFTLANSPNPTASLQLYFNGVVQNNPADYTITGTTITFGTAPAAGGALVAWYRF